MSKRAGSAGRRSGAFTTIAAKSRCRPARDRGLSSAFAGGPPSGRVARGCNGEKRSHNGTLAALWKAWIAHWRVHFLPQGFKDAVSRQRAALSDAVAAPLPTKEKAAF